MDIGRKSIDSVAKALAAAWSGSLNPSQRAVLAGDVADLVRQLLAREVPQRTCYVSAMKVDSVTLQIGTAYKGEERITLRGDGGWVSFPLTKGLLGAVKREE